MFFKRLEIYGFKSFAEKTKLEFEAGVTAIVGPNGCGKTNLLDAIKWVLGEQSVRSLRGATMEDVIFHGASDLSPIGFAEVSLTLSNQNKFLPLDYEEVNITRRIFRSGESEYLINKVPVRLKDIQEVLMGTGMGMRSYSLMEQGKVDQILNSKPEERRGIFEEASGITKYKSKKEEALRKLERTNENLQRIGDIIVEVKRQIKSIERQVNKARCYKDEFEKLKEYELQVCQYQYQDLKKEKKSLDNKISQQQKEEDSLNQKMNSLIETLKKIKGDLTRVEQELASIQAEGYQIETAMNTANNKIALDKERIEELNMRQQNLGHQIEEAEARIAQIVERILEVQEQIETVEQEKQAKLTQVTEKEGQVSDIAASLQQAQEVISQNKAEELEALARQTRLKNNAAKLTADLASVDARLRRLNLEEERTRQELDNSAQRHKICIEQFNSISVEQEELAEQLSGLKSQLKAALEKKRQLDGRLTDLAHQKTSLESKLSFLKEATKNYEGFSRGAKSILSAIDGNQLKSEKVYGAVANLIEVAPEYQLAIEMALGENTQAIVVEDRQTAENLINYLKEKDLGWAKLICLNELTLNKLMTLKVKLNSLQAAAKFVKIDPRYQKIIEYLLADTFIVQGLGTARQILQGAREPFLQLVTLNGQVLTRASMSGGSFSNSHDLSLLGRQDRIERSQVELEKLNGEITGLENLKLDQIEELHRLEQLIQQKEPDLNQIKIKLANKESEKSNIETGQTRFQEEISVLEVELSESAEQKEQLKAEQEALNQQLSSIEERQKQLATVINEKQTFIAQKYQEQQALLVEIAQLKTESVALDKETEDARRNLAMLNDSEGEQRRFQQRNQEETQAAAAKVKQLEEEIRQLESKMRDLGQLKMNIEEKRRQILQERQRFFDQINGLETKVSATQKALDQAREEKANVQIKLTELRYRQDSLQDKMQQGYQVDLQATLEDALEISPPEDSIFNEISRLKSRLEGMGPINLVAIEENEQLQQRYSFLVAQQEDLVKAQESLRKAIVQINRTARSIFSETFAKIQVSFKEYFRILFGGGEARLILVDEDNILESGIEIVVRPPGKRLQNISLLSGGEKALTAIALLFAIFKIKPSPFCILDEVDAALDEANVDRFTNLLSEFLKTSQFIIITHNKKTINMADVMYGITMEKSGVSKIVSVKLTQDEPTADTDRETVGVES